MNKNIVIINGPNLNLLGKRQTHIYGIQSFEEYFKKLKDKYVQHQLSHFQSNHEGIIIDYIHQFGFGTHGIVLNAGALTHTSIAIRDAIESVTSPVVEVHITNIYQREYFRRFSYIQDVCISSIVGQGLYGYDLSIDFILNLTHG